VSFWELIKVASIILPVTIIIWKIALSVTVRFIPVETNLPEANGLEVQFGHAKTAIGFIGLRLQAKSWKK